MALLCHAATGSGESAVSATGSGGERLKRAQALERRVKRWVGRAEGREGEGECGDGREHREGTGLGDPHWLGRKAGHAASKGQWLWTSQATPCHSRQS